MLSKEEIENNIKEKDSSVVETERIIIEIPKNTNYLSLVCFFMDKDGFNANNQILGIKPIKEKKEELEQLETENKELKADKQRIIELNNKYLQKLVYSLSPTTHALGDDYNSKFKQIIKENIDLETCKIKQKLKECWGIDKF